MKQLELWADDHVTSRNYSSEVEGASVRDARGVLLSDLANLATPVLDATERAATAAITDGPPVPAPLQATIEAGVFGMTLDGPVIPDEEEVEALTGEHANELIVLLSDWHAVEHAQRFGYDPDRRRVPSTPEQVDSLTARLDKECARLSTAYADALAAYGEGFGEAAAAALDEWVRKTVADGEPRREPYPPSHPWYYYHAGDNALPIPLEAIEPDPSAGQWLERKLPKNPARRMQLLRDMLEKERAALAADQERYKEIVDRGADALSRYDREIAHTSDAMAVATALALKYTHISQGLGRVNWLTEKLGSR